MWLKVFVKKKKKDLIAYMDLVVGFLCLVLGFFCGTPMILQSHENILAMFRVVWL